MKVKCGKTLRKHGWYFMTFVSQWLLRVVFEYSSKALDFVIGQVLF